MATVALEQTETKPAAKTDTPATRMPVLPGRTPGPIGTLASPQVADKFIGLAKTDLAGRLKIEVDQITLIDATTITWPDAALGCPEPGKVYAQGRVPGFKIQLQAGDKPYVYHTDQTGQFVVCPELLPDEPGGEWLIPPGPTPNIGVPIK